MLKGLCQLDVSDTFFDAQHIVTKGRMLKALYPIDVDDAFFDA